MHKALPLEQTKLHSGFMETEQGHRNSTPLVPMDTTLTERGARFHAASHGRQIYSFCPWLRVGDNKRSNDFASIHKDIPSYSWQGHMSQPD